MTRVSKHWFWVDRKPLHIRKAEKGWGKRWKTSFMPSTTNGNSNEQEKRRKSTQKESIFAWIISRYVRVGVNFI